MKDKHIAANHRGDDPDTIGSFPCECREDLEDEFWKDCADPEKKHQKAGQDLLKAFEWAIEQIKGKKEE